MSDLERRLLARVTNVEEMAEAWEAGVRREVFEEPLYGNIWNFSVDYWRNSKLNSVPTSWALSQKFPGYQPLTGVAEEAWWLAAELRKRFITNNLQEMLRAGAKDSVSDPEKALRELHSKAYGAMEVITPRRTRVNMANNIDERWDYYQKKSDHPEGLGVTYGLDLVDLLTGGIYAGEIAVIAAYAKCVSADSYVFTDEGLVRIGDISPSLKEDEWLDVELPISTRGGLGMTKGIFHRGKDNGVRVTSRFCSATTTSQHRFLVPTREGLVWKQAGDLIPGDQLLMDTSADSGQAVSEDSLLLNDGSSLTPELAGLLGWIIAEGHILPYQITVTKQGGCEYGDSCNADIVRRARAVFGSPPARQGDEGWRFTREQSRWLVNVVGVKPATARFKRVPECILSAPTSIVREFLRCYFEGDGDFSRGISVTSASKDLVVEVGQLLLHHFGVVTEVFDKWVKLEGWKESRQYWGIRAPLGDNGRRFVQAIDPISDYTLQRVSLLTCPNRKRTRRSSYVGRVKFSRLWAREVIEHLRGVVPDHRKRWTSTASNKHQCYQNLFPSRCDAACVAMTGGRGQELSLLQIREIVNGLSVYDDLLIDNRAWQALVECDSKGYFSSEVSEITECIDDFWDFSIHDTASYVVNGAMGHNTGKTMFLLNAAAQALRKGYKPIVFTLELSLEDTQERLDAMFSGVSYNRLTHGKMTDEEKVTLRTGMDELASLGGIPVERPEGGDRTVSYLCSRTRELGCDYLIIDQLSKMEPGHKTDTLKEKRASVITQLKNEVGRAGSEVPVLIAHQLRREENDEPTLKSLADAAEVEREVDMVMGLHRNSDMRDNHVMACDILGSRRTDSAKYLLEWELTQYTRIRAIREGN